MLPAVALSPSGRLQCIHRKFIPSPDPQYMPEKQNTEQHVCSRLFTAEGKEKYTNRLDVRELQAAYA